MPVDYADKPLAELAATVGGAMEVLGARRIDFWSRGERTLDAACSEAGVDIAEVEKELEAAAGAPPPFDWNSVALEKLIEHLLAEHNGPLRALLDRVQVSAEHLLGVHDEGTRALRQSLVTLVAELRDVMHAHLTKEELILFPALLKKKGASPEGKMKVMHEEHHETAAELEHLEDEVAKLPEGLLRRPAAVRFLADVRELLQVLEEHMHLENNILFVRVRKG